MNVIDTSGLTRAQWLELRTHSIGASDSPVIAGLSKYKSRLALWLEKTGQIQPDPTMSEAAWWGLELEKKIAERTTLDRGVKFDGFQVMVHHPALPWLTSTLDAVDNQGEIHQFKAAGFQTARGLEDGDNATMPAAWKIQAAHEIACADRTRAFWHVFVGGRLGLMHFEVNRDEELIESIFQLDREFWSHVEFSTPPAEFEADDIEVIRRLFDRATGEHVVIDDPMIADHAKRFLEAKEAGKYAAQEETKYKAAMLFRMGNASTAECGACRLTRTQRHRKAYPVKASDYIEFSCTNGNSTEDDE